MSCVFIYNNIKVSPFLPGDAPFPGFDLITFDRESYTFGTLWDIGLDAGYTKIGLGVVYGQLWKATEKTALEELREIIGVTSGLTEEVEVPVTVELDNERTEIKALTFSLTKIQKHYMIIDDGYWIIKRSNK